MKISNYYIITAASFLLMALSSCNLFSPRTTTRDHSLPTDRESIVSASTTKTYKADDISKGALYGDWAIETVNGKNAVGETAPFLKFVDKEHRIYGNNGCNVINAAYKYNPADSTLQFSNIISTMRACAEAGITDYEINLALDQTRYYVMKVNDNDYWITLLNENKHEVMTLMHQNFDFLNGTWRVTAINSQPVNNPDMLLVFDVDEQKIHGNTGCNILNGSFAINMEAPNSISFQGILLTRMACPDDSQEIDLVVALEDAAYAKPVGPTKVLLLDNRNNTVLQLDKKNLK